MQFIHTLILASGLVGAASALAFPAPNPTACNADNCLRQVRATNFPTRAGTADCKAYQTRTSTIIATTTVTGAPAVGKRDANGVLLVARAPEPTVPAYASSCDAARYASACSCISVLPGTVTVTSTATVVAPACPTGTFAIQVQRGTNGVFGKVVQDPFFTGASYAVNFADSTLTAASASHFSYVADETVPSRCRLVAAGFPGALSLVQDSPNEFVVAHYLRISDPAYLVNVAGQKVSPVYCKTSAASLLECTAVDSAGTRPDQTVLTVVNDLFTITDGSIFGVDTFKVVPV